MRKKIALALSMFMMVLVLGACGTDPTTVDYNGYSYDELKTEIYNSINNVEQVASLFQEAEITSDAIPDDAVELLVSYYGMTEEQIEAAGKWLDLTDELGEYDSAEDESFKVTKSGETLTTDLTLKFAERNVDFQVVYDYYSMDITGITIEPVYTLGEKMEKAALNTVISMSVVFIVLILISLLIACFKIFPYLEEKKAKKKTDAAADPGTGQAEPQAAAAAVQAPKSQNTDDTELIAVIAAAIAASTQTSTNDFVVRSINRR